MKDAACAGMVPHRSEQAEDSEDERDIFFPEKGESPNAGKMVCASCPVIRQCREYQDRTISNHGIWGGRIKPRKGT